MKLLRQRFYMTCRFPLFIHEKSYPLSLQAAGNWPRFEVINFPSLGWQLGKNDVKGILAFIKIVHY